MPREKQYDPEKVLQKAMYVFWSNGYRSTSLRMLEKELGINQFSIYSSFNSKHDLFVAVLKKYQEHMREGFLQVLISSDGDLDDIRRFFNAFVEAVQNGESPSGCLVTNTVAELGTTDQEVHHALRAYFDMMETIFLNLLEKSQQKGCLSDSVDLSSKAKYLVTCTKGLSVSAKIIEQPNLDAFIKNVMASLER